MTSRTRQVTYVAKLHFPDQVVIKAGQDSTTISKKVPQLGVAALFDVTRSPMVKRLRSSHAAFHIPM